MGWDCIDGSDRTNRERLQLNRWIFSKYYLQLIAPINVQVCDGADFDWFRRTKSWQIGRVWQGQPRKGQPPHPPTHPNIIPSALTASYSVVGDNWWWWYATTRKLSENKLVTTAREGSDTYNRHNRRPPPSPLGQHITCTATPASPQSTPLSPSFPPGWNT